MHKIVYLPIAEDDILAAVEYIAYKLDNPSAAEALLDELDKTVERVARFPYSSELYRTDRPMRKEIRMVSVKNYVLYYAVTEETVEMQRLIHRRRDKTQLF
ncbi:MAG: type II toxin-antitoxin system RelE/ParE family toxin [Oscillospiraceae bacterium]|nr:type II toxin-antitoxin system RelE/ParE family toxin [Oscillospiraceae bacterium]